MDNRVNAFKVIEKHCGRNKKEDIIFYMTYGVYKKTFLEDLRSRGKGRAPVTLPEADFQRLKGAHLVDKHIERYVKQAEEMLGDTLKNVQKAILDSHQQELKKIVQKDNWWREVWFAIGTNIAANLIYWGLAFIFFFIFKEQVASLLKDLVNNK